MFPVLKPAGYDEQVISCQFLTGLFLKPFTGVSYFIWSGN